MSLTTDPNHPDLTRGGDKEETPQAKVYLVLSDKEKAKGFIRPVRDTYVHVGKELPHLSMGVLEELSKEDIEKYKSEEWVALFKYNDTTNGLGKMCTQKEVDLIKAGKRRTGGCNMPTRMGISIAETYARQPGFYGFTYCTGCNKHLPVEQFAWQGTDYTVGS